jgi:hypothetical protein
MNPPGNLGNTPTMLIPQDCEWPGEIGRPKRIDMLCSLLLKKLAIPALGDDLHHVFLSCWPVESMSEGFADD